MPYSVTTTAGAAVATIADGTVDTTSTSLTLIGKNYAGYGIFLNENSIKVLENFSNSTPPNAPLTGQLWYDNVNDILKVYNSASNIWKPISSSIAQGTAPAASISVTGDIWWDTVNAQLKIWSGAAWITIGPSYTSTAGTSGPITQTILDVSSGSHVVVIFYISNQAIAILSKDSTFTPQTAIPGFTTIVPGLNLISQATLTGAQFTGATSGATTLGGYGASYFMSNTAPFTTGYALTVNGGLTVNSDLVLNAGGATALIQETTLNKNIQIQLNSNGVESPIVTYNATNLTTTFANSVVIPNTITAANVLVSANVLPTASGTVSIGSSTMQFANVWATYLRGTAIQANYADLAERFEADVPMVPGTVVELGGLKEITAAVQDLSEKVFGVISTLPGFLLNGNAGDDASHPPVAVNGRVPVRVIGTVNKGDRLVSAGNGLARAALRSEMTAFNVIGRALENKTTSDEGTIEAIVKLNS